MNINVLCEKLWAAIKIYEARAKEDQFPNQTANRINKIKTYLTLLCNLLKKEMNTIERLVLEGRVLMLTSAMLQSKSLKKGML